MTARIEIRSVRGREIVPFLSDLARLRIELFRGYPYLYDGDLAYEERYVRTYAKTPQSLMLLALDGDVVVGASTGLPLAAVEMPEVVAPFVTRGDDIATIFYCGESLLSPAYRGRGLYREFLFGRETFARAAGFETCAFCAVDRGPAHAAMPAGYRPLDAIWTRAGYVRDPSLIARYRWKDVGAIDESEKPMIFWLKSLAPNAA